MDELSIKDDWAVSRFARMVLTAVVLLPLGVAGCGGGAESPPTTTAPEGGAAKDDGSTEPKVIRPIPEGDQVAEAEAVEPKRRKFIPVELGSEGDPADAPAKPSPTGTSRNEADVTAVVDHLQPFQVFLGKWNWTTLKKFGQFAKHGEDLAWVWDFRTDKARPALVFETKEHPYFKTGRITWSTVDEKFELTTTSPEGEQRVFRGTWLEGGEPKEEHDGKRVQRSFKLDLEQESPAEGDRWKVTLQLLDNDQYQMQLTKRPEAGTAFGPLDVVRQQREGTSFAVADSDNPGPKCVVSGGLGSSMVAYNGKSYPVCCSGCEAAFKEDPERWIAKMMKKPE